MSYIENWQFSTAFSGGGTWAQNHKTYPSARRISSSGILLDLTGSQVAIDWISQFLSAERLELGGPFVSPAVDCSRLSTAAFTGL
jgi:hypothetical protein